MIGRILDASALDAVISHDVNAESWVDNAQRTSSPIVIPPLAVAVGRSRGWAVITADAGRLRRLDPDVEVVLV